MRDSDNPYRNPILDPCPATALEQLPEQTPDHVLAQLAELAARP